MGLVCLNRAKAGKRGIREGDGNALIERTARHVIDLRTFAVSAPIRSL
jgi:hypothetical protein